MRMECGSRGGCPVSSTGWVDCKGLSSVLNPACCESALCSQERGSCNPGADSYSPKARHKKCALPACTLCL